MDTIDPLILKMLVQLGQKSVTIALESGSERLRQVMKKNLSEAEIWHGMDLIAGCGIEQVKFYGIAGLPGETQEDLNETVRLLTAIKKKYKRLRIVFGVSSFVPKAQTPFQWNGRDKKSGEAGHRCSRGEPQLERCSSISLASRSAHHPRSTRACRINRQHRRLEKSLSQKGHKLSLSRFLHFSRDTAIGVFALVASNGCAKASHSEQATKPRASKQMKAIIFQG
jgi:hypothetical protein